MITEFVIKIFHPNKILWSKNQCVWFLLCQPMLSPQYSTYAAMSKLNYELAIFQTYLSNETLIADIGMSSKKI